MADIIKKHFKLILIILLVGIIMFFIGYSIGTWVTIKAVVYVARRFVKIDDGIIQQAIFQYKNNIGQCFPPLM